MTPEVADIDAAAEVCVTTVFAASTTRYDKTLSEGQATDDRAWMMCSISAMQVLRRPITDTEYHSSSSSAAGFMAGVAPAKSARALETAVRSPPRLRRSDGPADTAVAHGNEQIRGVVEEPMVKNGAAACVHGRYGDVDGSTTHDMYTDYSFGKYVD